MEAFLLAGLSYLVIMALLPMLAPLLGPEVEAATRVLAGGVERNSAIVVHVSLSVFVAMALWYAERKWLWTAMLLHFTFNFVIVCALYGLVYPILGTAPLGIWLIEGLTAVGAVVIALSAYLLWRNKGGPPRSET